MDRWENYTYGRRRRPLTAFEQAALGQQRGGSGAPTQNPLTPEQPAQTGGSAVASTAQTAPPPTGQTSAAQGTARGNQTAGSTAANDVMRDMQGFAKNYNWLTTSAMDWSQLNPMMLPDMFPKINPLGQGFQMLQSYDPSQLSAVMAAGMPRGEIPDVEDYMNFANTMYQGLAQGQRPGMGDILGSLTGARGSALGTLNRLDPIAAAQAMQQAMQYSLRGMSPAFRTAIAPMFQNAFMPIYNQAIRSDLDNLNPGWADAMKTLQQQLRRIGLA